MYKFKVSNYNSKLSKKIISKNQLSVTFKNLLINKRWRLDLYQEQMDEELDILSEDEEDIIDPQEKVYFY